MKQIRWRDFSLVSKIIIEVGMIAILLFSMNMLFYARINNSMQRMDNVYASNTELTELSQIFEKVQDNMYSYLKVKSSQALLDYYQNEAKYRDQLEKLNEENIDDSVKLLERNIRKMSETYLDCTAETVAAKRGRNVEKYKRKYDETTKLYSYIQSSIEELNNLMWDELCADLTNSEIQICKLVLQDKSLKEICILLDKTESNITSQRSHIRKKLNMDRKDDLKRTLELRFAEIRKKKPLI